MLLRALQFSIRGKQKNLCRLVLGGQTVKNLCLQCTCAQICVYNVLALKFDLDQSERKSWQVDQRKCMQALAKQSRLLALKSSLFQLHSTYCTLLRFLTV